MSSERINARLTEPLAAHVSRVVGRQGYYETPSEYIRSLIREDMNRYEANYVRDSIREGYQALAEGRYFKSTGDFSQDMELLSIMEGSKQG